MNATEHRVRIVTVREFAERFGTERQCAEHLARRRSQKGFACPACGHAGSSYVATRRRPRRDTGDGLSLGSHRRLEPRAVHPGPASCHRRQTRRPLPRGVRLSAQPPPPGKQPLRHAPRHLYEGQSDDVSRTKSGGGTLILRNWFARASVTSTLNLRFRPDEGGPVQPACRCRTDALLSDQAKGPPGGSPPQGCLL